MSWTKVGGGDEAQIEVWAVIEEQGEGREGQENITAVAGGMHANGDLYDPGASRHVSPFCDHFVSYRLIPRTANKRVFYAVGTGDLKVNVPNSKLSTTATPCMRLIWD